MCVPRTHCDYGAGASLLLWKGFVWDHLFVRRGRDHLPHPSCWARGAPSGQLMAPSGQLQALVPMGMGPALCVPVCGVGVRGGGAGRWGATLGLNNFPQDKREVQLFPSCWFRSGLQAEGDWGAPTPSLSPSPHTLSGAGFPGGPWGRPRISASS